MFPESGAFSLLEHPDPDSSAQTCDKTTDPDETVVDLGVLVKAKAYLSTTTAEDLSPETFLEQHCNLSEDEINHIYTGTMGQYQNGSWLAIRKGMVTASISKRVCTRFETYKRDQEQGQVTNTSVLNKLILEGSNLDRERLPAAIVYGLQNEEKAIDCYCEVLRQNHNNVKIQHCGLKVSKTYCFIGASADGIASCSCHGQHLIEVKAIEAHQDQSPNYAAQQRHCFLENGKWKLKKDSEFYYQIQMNLGLHEMDTCVLIIYTNKGIRPVSVSFSKTFFTSMVEKIVKYYGYCFFPYMSSQI